MPLLRKKKNQEEKQNNKIIFKNPEESTQQNLPIRDIYRGIVITKDDRYIKIMEVKPIAFMMMSPYRQEQICYRFMDVLKICPSTLQITAMTLPADLSEHINGAQKAMDIEKDPACLDMAKEYIATLRQSQMYGIRRRFFISFEYEKSIMRRPTLDMIVNDMERTASYIAQKLDECGNEVVANDPEHANYYPSEILYNILNRRKVTEETYDEHLNRVLNRYYQHFGHDHIYIPPLEYIAPDSISYRDKKFVVVDGMYYSFYYISSDDYNPEIPGGWLTPFISDVKGVDVNIYIRKRDKDAELNSLRRNMTYSEADIANVSNASQAMESATSTLTASTYLRNGILNGEDMFDMGIMLTVCGETPEEVDLKFDALRQTAIQTGVKFKPYTYDEENAFLSTLPLARMDDLLFEKTKRNVLTSGLASTYPFTTMELNDPKGILFGTDTKSGSLVLLDPFNEHRLLNYNVFIQGASGAGKTYAECLLALRMRVLHIPVYMIFPEKESLGIKICKSIGGQFIQLAPGSPNRINMMEIFPMDEEARKTAGLVFGETEEASFLSEKVTSLKNWISLLITDMNIEEKQLLDDAIVRTYRKFGITEDNKSLIDPTDPKKKRYKKMPILADLQKELMNNPDTKRLANIMTYFTTGSGRSFNGETNVNLRNDFIIFGMEKMQGELTALGLYMVMEYVWGKMRENVLQNKALIIDEWWALGKNPVCAEYSMRISKLLREYHGAFFVCTQQLKDILAVNNGMYGEALLGNCATRILMKTEESDSNNVQKILNLTETERNQIVTFHGKGNALFMTGNTKVTIHFDASETEHRIITTSQDDRIKYVQEMTEKEKKPVKKKASPALEIFGDSHMEYIYDEEYIKYRIRHMNSNEIDEMWDSLSHAEA